MRAHRTPEITTLRTEIAAALGLQDTLTERAFEQECRAYLTHLRWPGGVECPRCSESSRLLWLASRSKWHCYECRYQFSVTAGTLFHRSHLPVWKWFVAVHLMLSSSNGLSANELRRVIGGSYKTAWFAAHRIRAAMAGHGAEVLRDLLEAELRAVGAAQPPARAEVDRASGNVVLRVRRLVGGPQHQLSPKYMHAYLDERRWRLTHHGNPHVFRDTIEALLNGQGLSYDQLVAAA
jgi:transposase-like protein